MPNLYQTYLLNLLTNIESVLNIKSFSYSKNKNADISFKTYGLKDNLQRILSKIGLSKYKSADIKEFCKYDIIHIQHSYLFSKILKLKKIESPPKVIITLRGGDTYLKPWFNDKWKTLYKNNQLVDAFIVMSNHQKEYLQIKWKVAKEKIHVIPVSFGDKTSNIPKVPNREKLKLVSAFRMTWEKNIFDCIKFAILLKDKDIDFSYDFFGDGGDLSQLYYLRDKFNLSSHINIKGKVSNEMFKDKLKGYDFFIQLSLSESLGAAVIEAQSEGVPCIVSASGGLPETLINEVTGFVQKNNDLYTLVEKTIKLWKNEKEYFKFSKEAILFSNNNFSISKEIKSLENLYRSL